MFNYYYGGLNYPNFYPNKRFSYYRYSRPYFPYSRSSIRNTNLKNKDDFSTTNHNLNSSLNPNMNSSLNSTLISDVNVNAHLSSNTISETANEKNSTNENTSRSTICNESSQKEQAFFSILGLDLYFDDILILCLLFFLYTEKVKDEMLFICLIMLLLS